jgi:predicted thioesterase
MEFTIPENLKNTIETTVDFEKTATRYDSGLAEVFATPALIAIMEQCAHEAVQAFLPEGFITVGTEVNIKHLKATAVGQKVTCYATLVNRDRRELFFEVEAYDETGLIGKGNHARFIVNKEHFMQKIS